MSFKPYVIYATRLPILKPGHVMRIGDNYYQVITVRHDRKRFTISGAKTEAYRLYLTTDATYENLHGSIERNRIVHLQYLAVETATVTSVLWWGTQPLLSKDVSESITTITAPVDAPLEIDRWSFDPAMHLYLTQSATQVYDVELIEYEIIPYGGAPTRPYLHIMGNGQAIFVEAQATEQALRTIEALALKGLRKTQQELGRQA